MELLQPKLFTEANLDIEKLISDVHDRPTLWDMSQKDYSDRVKRKQCWEEITELHGFESDLTADEKKQLGDILQRKWKNIRDRFSRDIKKRKGKNGNGARNKTPYMYARHLEFLSDTVTQQKTLNSFRRKTAKYVDVQDEEEYEEEYEDDEEDVEFQESTSVSSVHSSASNISWAQNGKKRLRPAKEKISRSLDSCEKRAKMDGVKDTVKNNGNQHFLLSLVESLASIPKYLNTRCRIEIMQCIKKYETLSQQQEQPLTDSATRHSHASHQHQHKSKKKSYHIQPIHHTQMYVANQPQYPPRAFAPEPSASPAGSVVSCISNSTDERLESE